MLTPQIIPTPKVITESEEVAARLLALEATLSEELFQDASVQGFIARKEATAAHAPTAAGTYHWHEALGHLRLMLVKHGWQILDHKNCPLIVSPDKNIMIAVLTGTPETGKPFGEPTNQAEKGAVLDNAIQGHLFKNTDKSGPQLWVFLYHVERGINGDKKIFDKEIRSELSLPSGFDDKKISGWAERIIFSAIPLQDSPSALPVERPSGPIDIPVERKRAG